MTVSHDRLAILVHDRLSVLVGLGTRSPVHHDLGAGLVEVDLNALRAIRHDLRPAPGQGVVASAGGEQQQGHEAEQGWSHWEGLERDCWRLWPDLPGLPLPSRGNVHPTATRSPERRRDARGAGWSAPRRRGATAAGTGRTARTIRSQA